MSSTLSLSLTDLVLPDQCNHHGTLFGGAALSMLDKLAFILGSKALRGPLVTASLRELQFHAPVPAGSLTECVGRVARVGERSVTVDAQLFAEDLLTGERVLCLSGQAVMVSKVEPNPAVPVAPQPADAVRVAEVVFPGHTTHRGILHGGPAMDWLAKAGFAAATRHARTGIVMAASERLDFIAPAHAGEVVEVDARVVRTGRSSLTVEAQMHAENPETGERRHCTSASLVFVAIDHDGRAVPLEGK